jgi:PAS domain-containing protein
MRMKNTFRATGGSLIYDQEAHLRRPGKTGLALEEESIRRKQAEEALRESESRFRNTVEMLPEVVFETDLDANLTYANQRALDLFGYSAADLQRGLSGFEMLVPDDRNRFDQPKAEGDHCQRNFGDGTGDGGSETGRRRLCEEALYNGEDRVCHQTRAE